MSQGVGEVQFSVALHTSTDSVEVRNLVLHPGQYCRVFEVGGDGDARVVVTSSGIAASRASRLTEDD